MSELNKMIIVGFVGLLVMPMFWIPIVVVFQEIFIRRKSAGKQTTKQRSSP